MAKFKIKLVKCLCVLCATLLFFGLTACKNKENGTYYPTVNEMSANLEKNGYLTQFAVGERDSEGQGYVVDSLNATKGNDYIYFYWIEDAAHCKVYYDKLKELYPDSPHFVLIENDEKFGNIVYCGTENAISAAGIRVVKVDVKV